MQLVGGRWEALVHLTLGGQFQRNEQNHLRAVDDGHHAEVQVNAQENL